MATLFSRKRQGASIRREDSSGWLRYAALPLRLLGALLALFGIGGAVFGATEALLNPSVLPLRHVRLYGELHNLGAAELERTVAGYLGRNFLALDIVGLHETFTANPWIEQVSVQRRWPDTLEVRFQERVVFGHWGQDEMVDSKGVRFRPAFFREIGPWPQLVGPDGHEQNLLAVYQQANVMVNAIGLQIVRLTQDSRRAWWLTFDNGVEVKLGREQFVSRLQRFVDVYPRLLATRVAEIATVDLRYINGFSVRWKTDSAG